MFVLAVFQSSDLIR